MPSLLPRRAQPGIAAGLSTVALLVLTSACAHHSHRSHRSVRVETPSRSAEIHIHREVAEVHSPRSRGHGPPPWAPAHGHRHRHRDGVELVFDTGLGVYVAVGHADLYFHGQRYLRLRNHRWEVSVGVGGPWIAVALDAVPTRLHAHTKAKKAKLKKAKRHGHAAPPARYK